MTDAVLRVRADAAQARGVLGGLTTDIKGVGDGTFFAAKAGFRYKAALAGVATAAGLALKAQVNYGDWLSKTSERTGVAIETLSGYRAGLKKSGTDVDTFATGLQALASRMRDVQGGSGEAVRTFDDLGISATDAEGNLRPVNDVLLDVAERLSSTANGAQKAALAGRVFGEDLGGKLIPFLNQGREGLREMTRQSQILGTTWSDESAAAASKLKDTVGDLVERGNALSQSAAQYWIPIFTYWAEGVTLVTDAIFGLNDEQKRLETAKAGAEDRVDALDAEILALERVFDVDQRIAQSREESTARFGESVATGQLLRERERLILEGNLEGYDLEIGKVREVIDAKQDALTKFTASSREELGLRGLEKRAAELSAEAIARANRLKDDAAEASKKHAAALKTEPLALDTLRAQFETTGRSMEEMIGINLRNVQLTLQQGLEAGLITLEEFERRFTQASMTAQAQIDQIQAKSEMAKEVSIESTARATESFDSTGEAISNFSSLATTAMDGIRVASESAKKGGEDTTLAIVQLTTKVGAQIATMVAAAVTAAGTTAAAQVSSNAAITASAVPAAVTQGAATYGASATTGSGASIAAIAGGIAAVLGIVGSIAGIGDSGITPELFKRVTSANHSLFVMRSGETLVTNNGTRGLERQIQLTNDVLAREAAANEASAPVSISVYADSRHMERGIRVVQNRRDERGLPRSNQKRFGR